MYYICILACSASLLKVHGKVLNAVFDLFNYFRFHRPFLVMIGKIRSTNLIGVITNKMCNITSRIKKKKKNWAASQMKK